MEDPNTPLWRVLLQRTTPDGGPHSLPQITAAFDQASRNAQPSSTDEKRLMWSQALSMVRMYLDGQPTGAAHAQQWIRVGMLIVDRIPVDWAIFETLVNWPPDRQQHAWLDVRRYLGDRLLARLHAAVPVRIFTTHTNEFNDTFHAVLQLANLTLTFDEFVDIVWMPLHRQALEEDEAEVGAIRALCPLAGAMVSEGPQFEDVPHTERVFLFRPAVFAELLAAHPTMMREIIPNIANVPANDLLYYLLGELMGVAAQFKRAPLNVIHWMSTFQPGQSHHAAMGMVLANLSMPVCRAFFDHLQPTSTQRREICIRACRAAIRDDDTLTRHVVALLGYASPEVWLAPAYIDVYWHAYNDLNHREVEGIGGLYPLLWFLCITLCDYAMPQHQWNPVGGHAPTPNAELFRGMLLSRQAYLRYLGAHPRPLQKGAVYQPPQFDPAIQPFREEEAKEEDENMPEQPNEAALLAAQIGPMEMASRGLMLHTPFPSEVSTIILNMYLEQDDHPDPRLFDIVKARHNQPPIVNHPAPAAEGEAKSKKQK